MNENAPHAELPAYRSHKTVWGFRITLIDTDTNTIHGRDGLSVQVAPGWLTANARALNEDGYFVQYKDGYISWSPAEAFEAGNTPVQHWGVPRSQEPKYFINEKGRLTNRSTGKPIPDEEPVFVLRGQDKHAIEALAAYRASVSDPVHGMVVAQRIADFCAYAEGYPERMKEPDSKPPLPPSPS